MTTLTKLLRAISLLALFQVCALAQEPRDFTVKVALSGKGIVELSTFIGSVEGPSKTFTESGKITIQEGYFVALRFIPNDGYKVGLLTDNGEDPRKRGTTPGSASYGFTIAENHDIVVKFVIDSPTGTFPLTFKEGAGTPIVDITGTYTGVLPKKKNPYTLDAAMDESGKVDAMGSVDGFVNKDGENEVKGSGAVKTRNGKPMVAGSASTAGMLDGVPVNGSGNAKGPVEVTQGNQGPVIEGVVVEGTGKEDGARFTEEKQMVTVPAQPANIDKTFSVELTIANDTNQKGKEIVVASAILNMPNGDRTKFDEKKVQYSLQRGYLIEFENGIKIDGAGNPILNAKGNPTVDRKSTLTFSKLLLERSGATWAPVSGIMKYKFLGQKGKGDVANFLVAEN